jgi:hypothetical protein
LRPARETPRESFTRGAMSPAGAIAASAMFKAPYLLM